MSIRQIAKKNILHAIGNTPIVKFNKVSSKLKTHLYGKCEFLNPGGSIKDRIALYLVEQAEKKGILKPGGTIIEGTSGNTGLGLAIVAAIKGYKCVFVMADKQSQEKKLALEAMGAKVIMCPTEVDPSDDRSYYKVSQNLAKETPNSFYANQYHNLDNPQSHFLFTGPEIYGQCGNELDYLIVGLGTGGTASGIAKYLRTKLPKVKIIGVDPKGSIFYDLFYSKKMPQAYPYLVEGIGEDFLPSTIDLSFVDEIVQVDDEESFVMGRRLLKEEGLMVGGSSGSATLGAIKYFESHPENDAENKNALIILPDSSSRYISKYLADSWMREKGFAV